MTEYEANPVLEVEPSSTITQYQMPFYPKQHTPAEFSVEGADPTHGTVTPESAERELVSASWISPFVVFDHIRSYTLADLLAEVANPPQHKPPFDDSFYRHSYEDVALFVASALPASEWGYMRAITILHNGKPVPFLKAVLDADIPTGLVTAFQGKGSTLLKRLKYTAKGAKSREQYLSEEIDLTAEVPPKVEVTVRRTASEKMNRRKVR